MGRILNSVGKPLDGGPFVLPEVGFVWLWLWLWLWGVESYRTFSFEFSSFSFLYCFYLFLYLNKKMVRAEGRPVNPYMRAYPRGVIQTGSLNNILSSFSKKNL